MNTSLLTNIWLCDDDEEDHFVFSQALRDILPKAHLTTFLNGSDLLFQLHRRQPDILFLDINMPMMNGIECLKAIRSDSILRKLPIVIYSVSEYHVDLKASFGHGAAIYLVKPHVYQDLIEQLKTLFQLDWSDSGLITDLHYTEGNFIPFHKLLKSRSANQS
jgi:CheY-like chemotaxis protein